MSSHSSSNAGADPTESNYALYYQLENFLGQGEQRALWIFSYANLAGMFVGVFLARIVLAPMAGQYGTLLLIIGVVLGLLLTWRIRGQALYERIWSGLTYLFRRFNPLHTYAVNSSEFYDQSGDMIGAMQWMDEGMMFAYQGGEAADTADPTP